MAHEACETKWSSLKNERADLAGGAYGARGGHRGHYFLQEKIAHKQKIQKHNVNKICPVEPSLKEMTCLMTIAETKRLLATSNSPINITGIASQGS